MKLAAIDIGSNSIHLVVVQAEQGRHMEIIDREKEMARLGAGTLREHRLSEETIARAVTTLRRFKQIAESNSAQPIIATATSAVRESVNAYEFLEAVRKKVGLNVQLLPGVEEARLIALAVSEVTDFDGRRALIIDIGGGSTEFIITDGRTPELLMSVRLGAVRLSEKFITTDPISKGERERLVTTIRADLTRVAWEIKNTGFDFVVGTSGTILNLADMVSRNEEEADSEGASGFDSFIHTIGYDRLVEMNQKLSGMTLRKRRRVPGLEKGRADIIVAGGLLLETILSELGIQRITSCDWSLREGVILDYIRKHSPDHQGAGPLTESVLTTPGGPSRQLMDQIIDGSASDVRTRSVLSLARRYDYDAKHSHHIARLAAKIFDDTVTLHGMGEQERKMLLYAAILHDIGYHIAPGNHHRHSLYLIKNSEMPGFTGNEIALLATIVRYHRGSLPRKTDDIRLIHDHDDFWMLRRANRKRALKLASILQIADGLDRSYSQKVSGVACDVKGRKITFNVECFDECDLEIWSAERKARWFAEIFRARVKFKRSMAKAALKDSPEQMHLS